MDPEMLGLTYIKGASTDSGIDTNPCVAPGARVLMKGRVGEQGHPWVSEHHEDGASEEDHGKLYLPQGYASAILSSHVTEGSIGDLSEISSHSRYGAETGCYLVLFLPFIGHHTVSGDCDALSSEWVITRFCCGLIRAR